MKFYKRENLSKINPIDNSLSVQSDGRIDSKLTASLQLPAGTTLQRPLILKNGEIRYNYSIGSGVIEAYIDGSWQIIKTNTQQHITQQTFTNSNYVNTIFGPLAYNIDINSPQNLMVYVENVYQIPTTNYVLSNSTQAQPITTSTTVRQNVPLGGTHIPLVSIKNFNVGQQINGTNLTGNIVTGVNTTDRSITIFPGAAGSISTGGIAISIFSSGTFIVFSENEPPPSKLITALLGFDGFTPPFEV